MIYQDLYDMLRKKPFAPFRIVATDGRTYDVHHPDQALVLLTRVILPAPTNKDVPESSDHLSISQIVRFEELSSDTAKKSDGNSTNSN